MPKAGSFKKKRERDGVPHVKQLCVLRLVNVSDPKDPFQREKLGSIVFHDLNLGFDGILAIGPNAPKDPVWLEFLRSGTAGNINLQNKSSSAVIIVQVGTGTLAYCFGYGRYLLDDEYIDSSFGLRLALNIIDPDQIRSLDSKRLDNFQFSRHQTNDGRNVMQFGLDVESDMLHAVMGFPKAKTLCVAIAGRDSAVLSCRVELTDLAKKSREILAAHKGFAYRTHFEWVDNIVKIKDKTLLTTLDAEVVTKVNAISPDVSLIEKEIHDWYSMGMFNFTVDSSQKFPVLQMADLITVLNGVPFDDAKLRSIRVVMKDDTGVKTVTWRLYDTIHCDTTMTNSGVPSRFVLTGGVWYQVDKAFGKRIEDYIVDEIAHWKGTLPDVVVTRDKNKQNIKIENEDAYNLRPLNN